jgi:hypothetical protein
MMFRIVFWDVLPCKIIIPEDNSEQICGLFIDTFSVTQHVKWVPRHHGMARTQVADRGDALQIWRVAVNILNKQSRTADEGWPSSLRVGRGLTTPTVKKIYVLRKWTDFLARTKH